MRLKPHHSFLACALSAALAPPALATEPPAHDKAAAASSDSAKQLGEQVRAALQSRDVSKKLLPVVVKGQEKTLAVEPVTVRPPAPRPTRPSTTAQQQYNRAWAIAHGYRPPEPQAAAKEHVHEVHWSYAGEGGPDNWGRLNPDNKTCASGRRQSPIHIEDAFTLQGPAEAIQFSYKAANGTVVDNGHTIQVNVEGDNSITVRGASYQLLQFHFHHPAEERINGKSYAMVAHLVHRNEQGQLAVVAVLLEPGAANRMIHKVWTYLPLDTDDSVRMPPGMVDLNELLPQDQRYYQFMGSLTTPPCTEGVLWMVLKQPVSISPEQLKLFSQLFPHNARPVQAVNGRPVRDAQ